MTVTTRNLTRAAAVCAATAGGSSLPSRSTTHPRTAS